MNEDFRPVGRKMISYLCRWNPRISHLCGWNSMISHLCGWNPGISNLCRWNPTISYLCRWNPAISDAGISCPKLHKASFFIWPLELFSLKYNYCVLVWYSYCRLIQRGGAVFVDVLDFLLGVNRALVKWPNGPLCYIWQTHYMEMI